MGLLRSVDSEAYATLSFRQNVTLDDESEEIQLVSLNFADGAADTLALPTGEVIVVSSSADETTQSTTVTINTDSETVLDVIL